MKGKQYFNIITEPEGRRRLLMSTAGILLCGISIALCKMADWGTDPFQTFCGGLEQLTGIPFGILYLLINGTMLIAVFILGKKQIGIATVLNMTLMGFVIEKTGNWLMQHLPQVSFQGQIICFISGILMLCIGASLYFTAGLGVSAYDAAALILSEKTSARFDLCRIGCDLFCVAMGAICGAPIGIGTVITALCMGPVIEFFSVYLARPILKGARIHSAG